MSFNEMNNNKVYITGEVVSLPVFSHEIYGERFYEFDLRVDRLSNSYDIIPITVTERLLTEYGLKEGVKFSAIGQFRSYNKLEDGKSKLMLTVYIKEILPYNCEENPNYIEITGYVCKEPIFRVTPFKREITDVLLAVNRSYNKSDYLPCIAWGRNARLIKNFVVGDKVQVIGRIQSREYQKKLEDGSITTKTAYEVSLSKIVLYNDTVEEMDLEKYIPMSSQVYGA
ncbi:MAG: single-stranded DNA-binding protein [Clostridia bacterium]|nr:single-stranded DNA-binding protein [Clostridia bacterium]